jgi:hypothetical protein
MTVVALEARTSQSVNRAPIPTTLVRDLLAIVLLTGRRRSARSRLEDELGPELLAVLDGRFSELGLR